MSQNSDTGLVSSVQTALRSLFISPTGTQAQNELCQECRDLDLQKAMSYLKVVCRYQYGLLVADVGNRFKEKPENECPLCQMLFSSRLKPQNGAETQIGDEIRAFSFISGYEGVKKAFIIPDPGLSLCVVPRSLGFGQPAERMTAHFRNHGHSFCYDPRSTEFNILFPRSMKQKFDPALAKTWLEFCRKNHKSCSPRSKHVYGLKLIDCKTYSLVPVSPELQYVALSYVWGQGNAAQVEKGTSKILASTLSPVVSDAIQVTTALGFQYLWVDQLCIDQDDPTSKSEQIAQMDLVYHNAELTIVAAAGTGQSYGLPGVSSRSRTVQRAARVGKYEIIETMTDPHYQIRGSKWFTRAWTFQEGLLSRRRLIFTDDQIYYECSGMNSHEAIEGSVSNFHTPDKTGFITSMRGTVFGANLDYVSHHESFLKIRELLEQYTTRKLSYDDDSLNAFQGILRYFEYQEDQVRHLWGVPYILHDAMLKHYPMHIEAYLLDGLCWRHVHSCWEEDKDLRPRRRPNNIPSWSWAGWAGAIQHDREPHTHPLSPFGNLLSSLRIEYHDHPFSEGLTDIPPLRPKFSYPKSLLFDAYVVPSELIELIPSLEDDSDQNHQWRVAGFPASLNLSDGPSSPSSLLSALRQEEEYHGILLGMDNRLGLKPKANMFLLIVNLSDHVARRCGMMTIQVPHLNDIRPFFSFPLQPVRLE